MMDGYLGELDRLGCVIALTADHGMNAKVGMDGRPDVIYLQDWFDAWLGTAAARVILPITDPYVVHHGALGSFATVYLPERTDLQAQCAALASLKGMEVVLTRAQAAERFELPADRIGDLVCVSERFTVIGTSASRHDLSGLDAPLRSHGGISEQRVPWAEARRWVSQPQNIGNAVTQGIELEAKFRLSDAWAEALPIDVRANASVFRSSVASVPGPDNRLDQQAHATANLGGDYRFRGLPLTLGGNLNWVPGYETQLEDNQRTGVSTKRVFDLYALWTFNPALALRLLASNLAPRDYETRNTITFTEAAIDKAETARSTGPSYTNWQLRLEIKL
mgnify:CR=1 FL=1